MMGSGERAQSEVLGTVLILGLSIIILGILVMVGGSALDATEQQMATQAAEHTMSKLDSQVATVALGHSQTRRFNLGQSQGGAYQIDSDTGWLRVRHYNHSDGGNVETITNTTLGTAEYRNGRTTIGYQGGGVWRKTGNGSVMLSPPEMHYRGATLTLPIISVGGEGGAKGRTSVAITEQAPTRRIYANASPGATYSGTSKQYLNPVTNGRVNVTVHSEYYRAWADYFRDRTDGDVYVDHTNQTATLELIALAAHGQFDMPLEGNSVPIKGIVTHQIDEFTLTLFDDDSDSAEFSNLKWSLYAEQGNQRFEIYLEDNSGSAKHGESVRAIIYYSDDNGDTYHTWTDGSAFSYETEEGAGKDFNDDEDLNDKRLRVNLTADTQLTYQDGKPMVFSTSGDTLNDSARFSGHPAFDEPTTYTVGDTASVDRIVNHYMAEMGPSVDLTVEDKQSDTVNERGSYGKIEYGASGQFLTYLHISENRVNVSFSG